MHGTQDILGGICNHLDLQEVTAVCESTNFWVSRACMVPACPGWEGLMPVSWHPSLDLLLRLRVGRKNSGPTAEGTMGDKSGLVLRRMVLYSEVSRAGLATEPLTSDAGRRYHDRCAV